MLTVGNSYLFDTCVFIGERRKRSMARMLVGQARTFRIQAGYSIITEAELWAGIQASNLRTEREHKLLLAPFERYFINVRIARRAGELRAKLVETKQVQPKQGPFIPDCIIAATAEYYGLIVCSQNTRDFSLFRQFGIMVHEYTEGL